MNKKDLIRQRVMIYNGFEREGIAIIRDVEIGPRVVEILEGGLKVHVAYCKVKFESDPDRETYMRWIRTDNLMVQS